MRTSVTFKLVEILNFGKPTGLFTVRKIETCSTLEISSKVYESTSKKDCEDYLSFMVNSESISFPNK